jgi:integrase
VLFGLPPHGGKPNSVSTIERRPQLELCPARRAKTRSQEPGDRRRARRNPQQARRPAPAEGAILPEELIAMLETLKTGTLRGTRDCAMLLVGFAGGLRRSEITGLDPGRDQTGDARLDRDIRQGRAADAAWQDGLARGGDRPGIVRLTCPVAALETWIRFARLGWGPLFRCVTGEGKTVGQQRLNDQEVHALSRRRRWRPACGAIFRAERGRKFSGHSLRAGLASSAEVDERHIQKATWPCLSRDDPPLPAAA